MARKQRYYGIKSPDPNTPIWWIAIDKHRTWEQFFTNRGPNREFNAHQLPLATAIKAYEAIGYRCVELEIKEVEQ